MNLVTTLFSSVSRTYGQDLPLRLQCSDLRSDLQIWTVSPDLPLSLGLQPVTRQETETRRNSVTELGERV